MRLSKEDKLKLRAFIFNQQERLESLIQDYGENPRDKEDLELLERVAKALEKDIAIRR